jgi:hypothetical protein
MRHREIDSNQQIPLGAQRRSLAQLGKLRNAQLDASSTCP